ncbi:bromodomain-containing protein 8-like [Microplitis mediator]|uniref:bromodomain-containing protein 8-like n=1 Tax=Microplitis mediator TaxID=375433 RepID=UPI00255390C6|nr:bromodomain-containing protein 8-like [Microplitis mediator]
MTSVQDRLKTKQRESRDTWSTREQLCLASSVLKSGDQNWISVSRSLKPFAEKEALRPPDWFSHKSCANQYTRLIENVDTPKRKKRESGETIGESIVKRLTQERTAELGQILAFQRDEYQQLKSEVNLLKSGTISDDKLQKMWSAIEQEEREQEQKAKAHSLWLAKRQQKQDIIANQITASPLKKTLDLSNDTQDTESANDEEEKKSRGQSSLLTNLLKSPSPTKQIQNQTSTAQVSSPTIASLLSSNATVHMTQTPQTVTAPIHQIVTSVIPSTPERPSAGAPTLSMLLALPANIPKGTLPALPSSKTSSTSDTGASRSGNPKQTTQAPAIQVSSVETGDIGTDNVGEIIERIDDVIGKDKIPDVIDKDEMNEIMEDIEELIKEEITKSPQTSESASVVIEPFPVAQKKTEERLESKKIIEEPIALTDSPESEMAIEEIDQSTPDIAEIIGTAIETSKPKDEAKIAKKENDSSEENKSEKVSTDSKEKDEDTVAEENKTKEEIEMIVDEEDKVDEDKETKSKEETDEKFIENKEEEKVEAPEETEKEDEVEKEEINLDDDKSEDKVCEEKSKEEVGEETVEKEESEEKVEDVSEDAVEDNAETEEMKEEIKDEEEVDKEEEKIVEKLDEVEKETEELKDEVLDTKEKKMETEKIEESEDEGEMDEKEEKEEIKEEKVFPGEKEDEKEEIDDKEEVKDTMDVKDSKEEMEEDEQKGGEEEKDDKEEEKVKKEDKDKMEEETPEEILPEKVEDVKPEVEDKISEEETKIENEESAKEEEGEENFDETKEEPELKEEEMEEKEEVEEKKEKVEKVEKEEDLESKETDDVEVKKEELISTPENTEVEEESSLIKLSGGRAMKTYSKKQNVAVDRESEIENSGEEGDYRNWKKAVLLVYQRFTQHKYASIFLRPITEDHAPGYHSVIFRPMDLSTIKKNIENGTIRSTMHFQRDVMLMFQNALMYNKRNTLIYKMAMSMQEDCLQEFQMLVGVTKDVSFRRETRTAGSSSSEVNESNILKRKRSHITPSPHDSESPRMKKRKSEND